MQRIGIYGGTFNPPHIGHIRAAAAAQRLLKLDRLLVIPDRIAPHKEMPEGTASPEQRLQMLRIALDGVENVEVSDMELRREGPSYTVDTVEAVRRMYPQAEIILLVGTDMFQTFRQWWHWERILAQVSLGVFYRGTRGEEAAVEEKKAELERLGARVFPLCNDVVDISSTQLRRMLAFGCAEDFLPEGVAAYIRENGLYHVNANWKGLPMERLEKVVVSLLNPNRVNHVLGCRDTAVRLAERWGADVTDAARAGLLHDITKALDGPLQLTLCSRYGKILSDFSKKYPKTLHALTGSLVAERIFGENARVVAAICHHTTGRADMTVLEKIIYVADYMEPCRDFPGVDRLRELADSNLDAALKMGLEMTLAHLARQGAEVSPASRQALEYLSGLPL